MTVNLVPDLLRFTRMSRYQADTKQALDVASFEATRHEAFDKIAATKGDPMKLFGLQKQVATLESREPLINFAKTRANTSAEVLKKASEAMGTIGQELRAFAETGDWASSKRIAKMANDALRSVMSALGSSVSARMLFSGEKTGVSPLADMSVLMDDVKKAIQPSAATQLIPQKTYVADRVTILNPVPPPIPSDDYSFVPTNFADPLAPTPQEVVQRMNQQLDQYFRTPAQDLADYNANPNAVRPLTRALNEVAVPPQPVTEPFARRFSGDVYLGGQKSPPAVELGDNDTLDYSIRADHKALKEVMRQLAVAAAVEQTPGLNREQQLELYKEAGLGIIQAKDQLTDLRADMGLSQRRIEDAVAQIEAEKTTLKLARNDLIGVDPYEAATRLKNFETQLQAIYSVTARTARLSFLDYMR